MGSDVLQVEQLIDVEHTRTPALGERVCDLRGDTRRHLHLSCAHEAAASHMRRACERAADLNHDGASLRTQANAREEIADERADGRPTQRRAERHRDPRPARRFEGHDCLSGPQLLRTQDDVLVGDPEGHRYG